MKQRIIRTVLALVGGSVAICLFFPTVPRMLVSGFSTPPAWAIVWGLSTAIVAVDYLLGKDDEPMEWVIWLICGFLAPLEALLRLLRKIPMPKV